MNIENDLARLGILMDRNGTIVYKKPYRAKCIRINDVFYDLSEVEVLSLDPEGLLIQINKEILTFRTEDIESLKVIV